MAREQIDLTPICQRYKARVIRMIPQDDFYLVETNRGAKELRVWPRVDVMRWSFTWREQMARQGFRNVERFIRTRDAKPYVVSGKRGFTMTDHLRKVEPFTPNGEHARFCGQMVARMHQAQSSQTFPIATDLFKREQSFVVEEVKRARHLYTEFLARKTILSEADRWLTSQFPPLLERMERSAELLSDTGVSDEFLLVSHRSLGPENWGLVNDQLYLRGFYRPTLSVQHRDTASFLRGLYLDTEETTCIDAFLDGYEEQKPLAYDEYRLLLAFMAYPVEVWTSVEQSVPSLLGGTGQEWNPDSLVLVETAIRQQRGIDRLLGHIAERAESGRVVR